MSVRDIRFRLADATESRPSRDLAVGLVGTLVLAGVLFGAAGLGGLLGAGVVGVVWLRLGGPYGYVLGQILVATLLPIPLDDPLFLPAQGALLLVCFGRLLASARPLSAAATALGSLAVVGALVVVSLGSAESLWQASLLVITVAAVATALFLWYDPATGTVEAADE